MVRLKFRRERLLITVNEEVFSSEEEAGLHLEPLYIWAEEAGRETQEEGEGADTHKVLTEPVP